MADVTEPGGLVTPRAAPETRRAARAMREEAERRARAAAHDRSEPLRDTRVLDVVEPAPHTARRTAHGPRPLATGAPATRREAHAAELLDSGGPVPVRHARPRLSRRLALVAGLTAGAALLLGSSATVTAMMIGVPPDTGSQSAASLSVQLPEVQQLPVPDVDQSPPSADICTIPEFATALHAGDDEAAIIAAGGGEAFRAAVVEGRAPCVDLSDSSRLWTVVDKLRPANPIDYRPTALVLPDGVRNVEGSPLRADAASGLSSLVTAARDAGVGEIALESGFRSYETQVATYNRHVAERGAQADLVSARPGYSEHQLGLGADVVACAGVCGTLDELAATPQGAWIAEHAWEHGWIVRYGDGATAVTGYMAEPWHLRYVGPELAKAYHDGGWTSLEEFFGLPPAPGYAG